MGRAVWCDVKDNGHPLDERAAIMVTGQVGTLFFCKGHCIPAFVTAFHTAQKEGKSGIYLPALGGDFQITSDATQPPPPAPASAQTAP